MNYYEHHIRDYDAATAHLSWDEDLAYTRLLRWYYRKERPIPADVKEACRQVRAQTTGQRKAVESVLQEFFELREDGWHKDTCDEAIAKFQAGEPAREQKRENEETRLARHRAERAELFRIINGAGLHRPWNAPISELRELAKRLQAPALQDGDEDEHATGNGNTSNVPATPPATGTATPATATQYPLPTPHSPLPTPHDVAEDTHRAGEQAPPPGDPPDARVSKASAVVLAMKAEGIGGCNPGHPKLAELLAAGAEVQNFVSAAQAAVDKHKGFAYALGIVEGQLAEARSLAAAGRAGAAATVRNGHSGSSARAARMAEAVPGLVPNGRDRGSDFVDVEARNVTP